MTERTRFVFVVVSYPTTQYGETTTNKFIRFKELKDCTYINLLAALKNDMHIHVSINNIVFFNEDDFNEFSKGCHIIEF